VADGADRSTVVVPGIDALRPEHGRLFVAVGVFDGLHLGHLYLLRHLREAAAARGARPAVITFDHHPDEILTGAAPALLCDPDERLALLARAGIEVTVVQHFDVALRMTSHEEFIGRIAAGVDLAGFLMTPDSAFGHERRGTPEAVAALGTTMGYDVVTVPPLDLEGRPVRSAEIREDIAAGDLAGATALLGRPYAVVGERMMGAVDRVHLAFPMPVALPPAGAYPTVVGHRLNGDGEPGVPATVTVLADGRLDIEAEAVASIADHRLRVTFVGAGSGSAGRLPDPDDAGNIRRS